MVLLTFMLKTIAREEKLLGTIVKANNKVASKVDGRVRINRVKLTEVKKLKNLTYRARFNFSRTDFLIPEIREYKKSLPIFWTYNYISSTW